MLRRFLGVLAGIVGGTIVVGAVTMAGLKLFQPPQGIDLSSLAKVQTPMSEIPWPALVMSVLAWALGALAAGWIAAKVANGRRTGLVAGAFLLLATIMNLVATPHPAWMWVLGVLLPLPLAWVGARAAAGPGRA